MIRIKILNNQTTFECEHCGEEQPIHFYDKNSRQYQDIQKEISEHGGVDFFCDSCGGDNWLEDIGDATGIYKKAFFKNDGPSITDKELYNSVYRSICSNYNL